MTKETTMAPRERMVRAALALLAQGGRDAVTTRAVSAQADVQVPAIYRQFGDMRGLLDAAATYGFASYLEHKKHRPHEEDPVDDLRRGWDLHVEFGLTHPAVYSLLYADPRPGADAAAVNEGHAILRQLLGRIAAAGRLGVEVEHALLMVHSACKGVALTLMAMPPESRDLGLSQAMRELMISAITTGAAAKATRGKARPPAVAQHAIALKAVLAQSDTLTATEAALMREWLDRLARSH
jgi:AcrR family transcriptional regulator